MSYVGHPVHTHCDQFLSLLNTYESSQHQWEGDCRWVIYVCYRMGTLVWALDITPHKSDYLLYVQGKIVMCKPTVSEKYFQIFVTSGKIMWSECTNLEKKGPLSCSFEMVDQKQPWHLLPLIFAYKAFVCKYFRPYLNLHQPFTHEWVYCSHIQ